MSEGTNKNDENKTTERIAKEPCAEASLHAIELGDINS